MEWGSKRNVICWLPLIFLLVMIWIVRLYPSLGEGYSVYLYPYISAVLSSVSSLFSFSVGDCFVVASITTLLVYLIFICWRHFPLWKSLRRVLCFLLYIYVWFYFAWGLNYFRKDFYARTNIPRVEYNQDQFRTFLSDYVTQLNAAYVPVSRVDTLLIEQEVKNGYSQIASRFGIMLPDTVFKPKPMLSSALMSKVGVLGYMEPFFSEFCLNKELLPFQYAACYAHELSHRLSIAEEAEANLYAYLVCTGAENPEIRFSGYFSLFPYVMNNAAMVLPENEYAELVASFRPEILKLYKEKRVYWNQKYSPLIGSAQHTLYNMFLKGNRIASGTGNYSEVIGLLISYKTAFPDIELETILATL